MKSLILKSKGRAINFPSHLDEHEPAPGPAGSRRHTPGHICRLPVHSGPRYKCCKTRDPINVDDGQDVGVDLWNLHRGSGARAKASTHFLRTVK